MQHLGNNIVEHDLGAGNAGETQNSTLSIDRHNAIRSVRLDPAPDVGRRFILKPLSQNLFIVLVVRRADFLNRADQYSACCFGVFGSCLSDGNIVHVNYDTDLVSAAPFKGPALELDSGILLKNISNDTTRIACRENTGRDIARHYAASTDYRARPDMNTG